MSLDGISPCEFETLRDGLDVFLSDGPVRHPQFAMLADDMRRLVVERSPAASGTPAGPRSSPDSQRAEGERLALH